TLFTSPLCAGERRSQALIERDAGVQLPGGALVEAAATERVEFLAEFVRVAPAADIAGDSASRADLEHVGRGADNAAEQRARRNPARQHQVGLEAADGLERVDPQHILA